MVFFFPRSSGKFGTNADFKISVGITVGAGVLWNDAYKAVQKHGRVLVGGLSADGTVGAAGGWLLGGGHGIISPLHGLGMLLVTAYQPFQLTGLSPGVDNVIEINIVTADGRYLTVNSHQHSDLFWALRGGGGGTFGVVTSVTYRTHPSTTLTVVGYNSSSSNPNTMRKIFKEFVRIHPALSDIGFSGYGSISNNSLNGFFALSNSSIAKMNQSLDSFFEYARKLTSKEGPNLTTTTSYTYDSFYSFYNDSFATAQDVEGAYIEIGSRLIPRKSFENDYERLADVLFDLGIGWKYVC